MVAMPTPEGTLDWYPLADRLDLVAAPVAAAAGLVPRARVAQIDPHLADTAAFCQAYDVDPAASANCVVVTARRGENVTHAAVMVLATHRADINGVVRRHLGARRISFADQQLAEADTGMVQGGITPVGLPQGWPVLLDEAVLAAGPVVIGAGVRGAKLLLDAADLLALPGAEALLLASPAR